MDIVAFCAVSMNHMNITFSRFSLQKHANIIPQKIASIYLFFLGPEKVFSWKASDTKV